MTRSWRICLSLLQSLNYPTSPFSLKVVVYCQLWGENDDEKEKIWCDWSLSQTLNYQYPTQLSLSLNDIDGEEKREKIMPMMKKVRKREKIWLGRCLLQTLNHPLSFSLRLPLRISLLRETWATTRHQLGETTLDSLGHDENLKIFVIVRIKQNVTRVIAMIMHVNGWQR